MLNKECEHLKNLDYRSKHPIKTEEHEADLNRCICSICNCYKDYKKRVI